MEAAPVNKARRLAKAKAGNMASAAQSSDAAALEYSKAAEGIEEGEALRILNLLEDHHRRLANIIRSQGQRQRSGSSSPESSRTALGSDLSTTETDLPKEQPLRTPSPESHRRPRDYTSNSLATGLASARGIPSSAATAGRRTSSPLGHVPSAADRLRSPRNFVGKAEAKSGLSKQSAPGETTSSSQSTDVARQPVSVRSPKVPANRTGRTSASDPNEAGFNAFYSTFGGLISKISAPLAFAGLPLIPKDAETIPAADTPLSPASTTSVSGGASDDIQVNKLFSKAAVHALQDGNGWFPGAQESFLVIPNGPNPYSKLGRESSAEGDDGQEVFVDATDKLQSTSRSIRRPVEGGRGPNTQKTLEELETENAHLKQLTDKISRRLYDWEKMAQKQGAVLQQSMRTTVSTVSVSPISAKGVSDSPSHGDSAEAEAKIKELQKDLEKYTRENEKLKGVVVRYRERWDKLREGARNRRESNEPKDSASNAGAPEEP